MANSGKTDGGRREHVDALARRLRDLIPAEVWAEAIDGNDEMAAWRAIAGVLLEADAAPPERGWDHVVGGAAKYADGGYANGMSLRDYFAAWAIGMPVGRDQDNADPAAVARAAYAIADAMLAERAIACVNACAGMKDPAAEIAALRTALRNLLVAYEHDRPDAAAHRAAREALKPLVRS